MRQIFKWVIFISILLTSSMYVFAWGELEIISEIQETDSEVQETDSVTESFYLGKSNVGLRGLSLTQNLPYYKPEGITQIPSRYFKALIIHQMTTDNKILRPTRLIPDFGADDTMWGVHIIHTEPEAAWLTLEMPWNWVRTEYTNEIIKRGLFFFTSITGRSEQYIIPYGTKKVTMVYSIRFLIYDMSDRLFKLIDTIESEKMMAEWELEWHLPEDETD